MNFIDKIFRRSPAMQTSASAEMGNEEPGYLIADTEFVSKNGLLERFLVRGREREDAARGINDVLLTSPHDALRYFLVQRKTNGAQIIHAEFTTVIFPDGAVIGPVATAPQANHSIVREKRMMLLARVSNHPNVKAGRCYAITVPNKWDDVRALREFGFLITASISVGEKANLVEIVGGREATFAVQTPGKAVLANVPTAKTKHLPWSFMFDGSIELGPSASIKVEAHRGTAPDEEDALV